MKEDDYFNINDTYKIKQDLSDIKKLLSQIEEDVAKFLGPKKVKRRGVKARSKITKLKNKLLPNIARKILKTRQDYDSDYS